MTGRGFQIRAAIFALAVVAILSTGLPGALHRLSAHTHAIQTQLPSHSHTCGHTSDDHGQSPPTRDNDHNHSEGSCDLCLMLAAGGQWGAGLASAIWVAPTDPAPFLAGRVSLVDSLPIRARSARGPPMISVG